MKIAIFYNLAFGGAKRVVYEQVKGLKTLGHTVDIYTTDEGHDIFDPGAIANNEFRYIFSPRIIPLPFIKRVSKDFGTFYTLKQLHKKIAGDIDRKNYDAALIHTDTITQSPFLLRFLKTKNLYFSLEPLRLSYEYSLRISGDIKGINFLYEYVTRYMREKIDRENALAATAMSTISLFGREYAILAYDLYPHILYIGVDEKVFKKKKIKKKNQILFIGQKVSLNGYEYAFKAMEYLPKKNRPELKVVSLAKTEKERLTEDELITLYNESLVTLSLSTFDTFGLITIESLACETPVVAFNVAGYRETMIDEKTGFLVDFDAKQIAEKVQYLLKHPEIAEKMGAFGRKWIEEKWTWEKQIKDLEKVLVSL